MLCAPERGASLRPARPDYHLASKPAAQKLSCARIADNLLLTLAGAKVSWTSVKICGIATSPHLLLLALGSAFCPVCSASAVDVRLPDGTNFVFWEQPLKFSKTYHVDNGSANSRRQRPRHQRAALPHHQQGRRRSCSPASASSSPPASTANVSARRAAARVRTR